MKPTAGDSSIRISRRHLPDATQIALLEIDYPPLNVGSQPMRAELLRAIEGLEGGGDLAGLILTGANGNFVAGADIREFDAPPRPPHLGDIIAALESFPHPVVAAIDGAALGGGFELALGCDARVASPRAVVGLPEVTLGLIPGAGGTQRLPRLVGVARAISLIAAGRRLRASDAAAEGLVDAVAEGDLISAAVDFLRSMGGKKRTLLARPVVEDAPEAVAEAEAEALRRGKGAAAVAEAIAAVKAAAGTDPQTALAAEREASLRLRLGPESKALRYLFLAERAAVKTPADTALQSIRTVGVIGGGRMGKGIVLALATRGLEVRLVEQDEAHLATAMSGLRQMVEELEARKKTSSASRLLQAIRPGDLAALAECDLVVEAIVEDMDAKRDLFARLDNIVRPDAILASNTSYLNIDELAARTARPQRVAGLHFFNPAHVMRLVEVVRGARTAPQVVASLRALGKRLGKVPVVAGVGEGFIGNRIFSAYRRHCEFLLEEGALPETVDRAMRDFGMAMGPFAVFDLAGLDIAWAARKRLAGSRDPRARYVDIPDWLCEAGRFGRKTGKGWYDYTDDSRGRPDPEVTALIESASREKGLSRRAISGDEIQSRLLAAIVNEAAWVLAEGIAECPADIDLAMVHGYGFPALKGGPLHFAARQPREAFLESVSAMAQAGGVGVEVAPGLAAVLDRSAP
ncbi:3-hydroxyacyl-CoA dehydrogenase NAD-binding domain-containing protein [Pelagibius sp. CAU 1746]|uniref:3-hydroxyacyl-CoA dehydrogenase NAD-binding domain-containing protein n=1 Tax=Pelagibius sp. CAU 1746 TaxID=3140370 RepID=UPI00325C1FD5